MYVGLWSRLAGFRRDQLTRALERRTVVQGTLLRATIHLVSREDYWPMLAGIRAARRENWLRYQRGRLSKHQVESAATTLRQRLEQGQSARKELIDGLDAARFNGAQQRRSRSTARSPAPGSGRRTG